MSSGLHWDCQRTGGDGTSSNIIMSINIVKKADTRATNWILMTLVTDCPIKNDSLRGVDMSPMNRDWHSPWSMSRFLSSIIHFDKAKKARAGGNLGGVPARLPSSILFEICKGARRHNLPSRFSRWYLQCSVLEFLLRPRSVSDDGRQNRIRASREYEKRQEQNQLFNVKKLHTYSHIKCPLNVLIDSMIKRRKTI